MSENEKNKDNISNSLGINPLNKNIVDSMIINSNNDSALKDFEISRANLLELISTIKNSIDNLSQIADSSQHPRSYEVLAKLSDSYVMMNKSLLELQEKIKQLKEIDAPINGNGKTINNNLFVGSTAELQKLIKDIKDG